MIKVNYINWVISFLAICILSACSTTHNVSIDVLEPAEITIPATIQTIGIIDQSNTFQIDTILAFRIDELPDPERYIDEGIISKLSIEGLSEILEISPRFNYKIFDSLNYLTTDSTDYVSSEDWASMRKFCHDSLIDGLLILKQAETYDPFKVKYNQESDFFAEYFVLIYNHWRLYDPIEQIVIDTSYVVMDNDFLDFLYVFSSPNREPKVIEASNWAGQRYGFRIAPYWQEVVRNYYVWPGKESYLAHQYVISGDWLTAARIWNEETENQNKKIAYKACFNMALASEANDNINMAIFWINKSLEIKSHHSSQNYLNELRQRRNQRNRLDEQLNK